MDDKISLIYKEMQAECNEIRVDDSFIAGFKYAMSFVKKAMLSKEACTEFVELDVFDGEEYI